MSTHRFVLNGRERVVDADPEMPLLWVIRDRLGLTGTKYGCGEGLCGSCVVLEGDHPVRSCQITLAQASGRDFTTIEGLAEEGDHPVQRAWLEEDVSQCGYCQPGMILEAVALLRSDPAPDDRAIDDAMQTHVCRCGTHARVRRAVKSAAGGRP